MRISNNGVPRRSRLDLFTPAEHAIRAAMLAVEEAGCHVLLTAAVILLGEAREKVADFVELGTCDRCWKAHGGEKILDEQGKPIGTAGYYEVGPSGAAWGQFANPGECVVCDACMWADPRYIAVHGDRR